MTTTVKALWISDNPTIPAELRDIPTDLESLQKAIQVDTIEGIFGNNWHAFVAEAGGRGQGAAINDRATVLARYLGWPSVDQLRGQAIFLGEAPGGEEGNVPDSVVAAYEHLGYPQPEPYLAMKKPDGPYLTAAYSFAERNGGWVLVDADYGHEIAALPGITSDSTLPEALAAAKTALALADEATLHVTFGPEL